VHETYKFFQVLQLTLKLAFDIICYRMSVVGLTGYYILVIKPATLTFSAPSCAELAVESVWPADFATAIICAY